MYVPLDVNFPDNDKVIQCSLTAVGLYVQTLCICKRLQRDGDVNKRVLYRYGATDEMFDELYHVGLLTDQGDAVGIPAWLGHNQASDEYMTADRGSRMAHVRWHVGRGVTKPGCEWCQDANQQFDATRCLGNATASPQAYASDASLHMQEVEIEEEIEIEQEKEPPPSSELVLANGPAPSVPRGSFDEWWLLYPRKVGKQAAKRKYAAALKRASEDQLRQAVCEHARAWTIYAYEDQFIPHPATWLEQGRWEDQPPGPRSNGTRGERNDRILEAFLHDTTGGAP